MELGGFKQFKTLFSKTNRNLLNRTAFHGTLMLYMHFARNNFSLHLDVIYVICNEFTVYLKENCD